MDNNEKKYPNTNLVSNEKKTSQHQDKNQTYPSPTKYANKRKNSVSNEKKSQQRRKNKRTKLTSCLHYSKPVCIVNKPKSTEKKEKNWLMMKKKLPNTEGKVKERSLPTVHAIPIPTS